MKTALSTNDLQTISDNPVDFTAASSMTVVTDRRQPSASQDKPMLLPFVFTLVFVAALAGVLRPYKGFRRKHFAIAAAGSFVAIGTTVPPPSPEEVAAREAKRQRDAAETRAEAMSKAAIANMTDHDKVVEKGEGAVAGLTRYEKKEYRQTFKRVGAETFARLNSLEPGAVWAAAESKKCNQVTSAAVSERSAPGKALWFADCENGNRFVITQVQAKAALDRHARGSLALNDLEESCTTDSVALCRLSVAQRAANENEVMFVSNCDLLLEQALVSPSTVDKGRWTTSYGSGDTITYRRPFGSQNSFGAMIRSRYRCDVDGLSGRITRFDVEGPMGSKRML